jgi:hypothetical protein
MAVITGKDRSVFRDADATVLDHFTQDEQQRIARWRGSYRQSSQPRRNACSLLASGASGHRPGLCLSE